MAAVHEMAVAAAPWRGRLRSYGLLGLAVLVFTGCLLFSFQRIKQHHAIELLVADAIVWEASRAEYELERLRHALDSYALGSKSVDHDDLLQRFDIFWNTLSPLLSATDGDTAETRRPGRPDLIRTLGHIEPDLVELQRGERQEHRRIAYRLDSLAPPLRRLTLDARASLGKLSTARSTERHILYLEQAGSLLGILASGGLLIGLLFRETRRTRALLGEARAARARIEHLAHHDALTDVPNRWLFNDRLGQALRRAHREGELVAVHCLDLDHFKSINDTLGHIAGDQLLVAVADRLLACLRDTDTLARIGGDEFAIVQTGLIAPDGAVRLSHRLLSALRPPIMLGTRRVHVSLSIGISIYPHHGSSAIALHHAADVALYRAKAAGRAASWLYQQPEVRAQDTACPATASYS